MNKTVKPAIEFVKKLLANINASPSIPNNMRGLVQIPSMQSNFVLGNVDVATDVADPQTGLQPPVQLPLQLNTQPPVQLPLQQPAQQLVQLNGPFGGIPNIQPAQLKGRFGKIPKLQSMAPVNIQPSGLPRTFPNGPSRYPSAKELIDKFKKMQTPSIPLTALPTLRTVGGNPNEDLKIKYLDSQKYEKLSNKELEELKKFKRLLTEDDDNKIGQLSIDIDNYYANNDKEGIDDDKKKEYDKDIIQKIKNFENDPKNPLEELALTFDDRIVFIIATFFIRYITIIMVQWCIDINIIKTFYEGFIYYAVIYIIIFWFIVLFINIDNSFDVKYMNFNGIINSIRTLFYYFYMGTNGISRLLIHTSLIMILIIIPIILNIKKKEEYKDDEQIEIIKILNYDERKQLSKSLSLFTMFIWLFTSIIATKF